MILDKEIIDKYLSDMAKLPSNVHYRGDINLLRKPRISIVGTRKPSQYTRLLTRQISTILANLGICIVSGGAMGVDALAHTGATAKNTIAVLPCGIDIKYPAVNKTLLSDIEKEGLLLSQFDEGFRATSWSFVVRNELVVALGDILIVAEADLKSGSMRSVEYAIKMKKEIYVLSHRIGESRATQELLQENKATAIYDIDNFVSMIKNRYKLVDINESLDKNIDPFIEFCKTTPTYEEVMAQFGGRVFEAELSGIIDIKDGRVFLC